MDKKLFEEKLSQVADWHIPKVTDVKIPKPNGRPNQSHRDQQAACEEWLQESGGVNDTLPIEIVAMKDLNVACEFCDKINPNGTYIERKQYMTSNIKYWRSRCITCGKYENPNTGKFDLTGTQATYEWNNRLRYKKNQDLIKKI